MKRNCSVITFLLIILTIFSGCTGTGSPVMSTLPTPSLAESQAASATPSPTPSPLPTLAPTLTPTPIATLEPTLEPSLAPEPEDPKPETVMASSYGDKTVIKFADAQVEAAVRKLLGKAKGKITAADMLDITEFKYDANNDTSLKKKIKTLDDLRYCENLETINISNQPLIKNIKGLQKLKNLTSVTLFSCGISDLKPLAGKQFLRSVWISGNPVSDASPVLSLPNLEEFNAWWGTNIRDISALKKTHNLLSFYCQNKLKDYSPLLGHKDMMDISLLGITNKDFVAMLGSFKYLRNIILESSTIKDSSLKLLKGYNLYGLTLNRCGIKDISALSCLTTVQDLRLTDNKITDVSALSGLTQIGYCLDLRNNNIKDFRPLKGMTVLQSLWVTGNPYKDDRVFKILEGYGCSVTR